MIRAPKAFRNLRRLTMWAVAAVLGFWIVFLDSHSLFKRVQWHREHSALQAENVRLAEEIALLEHQLATGISDEVVERIAREQYGMQRPAETIYRVEQE